MTTAPFKLPLTPAEFTAALEKGQGRALMHVRGFGLDGLEESFINGCLNEQRYDAQAEESRIAWLCDMATATHKSERLLREVAQNLGSPTKRMEDALHRCELALELALRGYEEAAEYLRRSVRVWPGTGHIVGEMELLTLDGAAGLVRIVELIMKEFRREPVCHARSAMYWYDHQHGEDAARTVLDDAAHKLPAVAKFLRFLDEPFAAKLTQSPMRRRDSARPDSGPNTEKRAQAVWEERRRGLQAVPATQIIEEINSGDRNMTFRAMAWGRIARKDALAEVFEAMLSCSETIRLRWYLCVFAHGCLDRFDSRLPTFVSHEDDEVRWRAIWAMSNYADPAVREFAIERLNAGRWSEGELRLLRRNYRQGDIELIAPVLQVPDERDKLHRLVSDLVEIYEENPQSECLSAMLFVYEHTQCSNCRRSAMCALLESGVAPDWLKDECRSDCAESIREFVLNESP